MGSNQMSIGGCFNTGTFYDQKSCYQKYCMGRLTVMTQNPLVWLKIWSFSIDALPHKHFRI